MDLSKPGPKPSKKLFDTTNYVFREVNPIERPKYLELLFKALKTIKPTSVEAERAFSAMGFFVTKLRNRMGDETLDGLITMRKYYQKSKQ